MLEWIAVTTTSAASGLVGTVLAEGIRFTGKWDTVKDLKAASENSMEAYQKVSTLIEHASRKEHNEDGGHGK